MNCPRYDKLTPIQQTKFIGDIVVALQSSDACFEEARKLRKLAKRMGIYDRVKVLPKGKAVRIALSDLDSPIEQG